jgi:glutamate-1-semialdehyde 2,1-aminomutase
MSRQGAFEERCSVGRSLEIYNRAEKLIPGVSQLLSRRPSRWALGVSPIYAKRAKGCRIWDVDGNEYIDWMSGVGPIILGYADPVVDAAVKAQVDDGSICTLIHESAVELAEMLVRLIPSAEMVRFAKGGGEACAIAVRIARGVTGRDKVLFCGYHGWHDWYIAANHTDDSLDDHLFPGIDPIGVPKALAGSAIPFKYGDLNHLEDALKANNGEISCIIMEPMRSELPPANYLESVRQLATSYGVVLIFDEVSSGFRIALGGAQEFCGVTPDISVFAKAISNGFPMAAVVGKREFMEPSAQMFISSAYWDDAVGFVAALATLKELERRDAVAYFTNYGTQFKESINRCAENVGLNARCVGAPAEPSIRFKVDDPEIAKKVSTLFIQENAKRGVILMSGLFLNCAHDKTALEQTEAVVQESFAIIQEGLKNNKVDELLDCELQSDLFRRLVE